MRRTAQSRRFVITGTSGTGKTAILERLRESGYCCFEEPGRKILAAHLAKEGDGFAPSFIERMLNQFLSDHGVASSDSIAFFDRGLPDAVAYAIRFGVDPEPSRAAARTHRYETPVFLAPLWPDIFEYDEWRRAPYDDYVKFHGLIIETYRELDYPLIELPKESVESRMRFIQEHVRGGT